MQVVSHERNDRTTSDLYRLQAVDRFVAIEAESSIAWQSRPNGTGDRLFVGWRALTAR